MKHLGAIAAGHPDTANAAAAVLAGGGNAFDAALAAVCAACVAEPVLASLGGGGFLMARPAGAAPALYDFFPQTPKKRLAPSAVDFRPVLADFGTAQQEFHIGMGAMATPGLVRGIFRIHRDLGSLPFARIIQSAVRLARQGVVINPQQAQVLQIVQSIYLSTDDCRRVYGSRRHPGKPLGVGETLSLPDFADTLEALAEQGEDWFYEGETASRLVDDCRMRGGLLGSADLRDYQVAVRQPLDIALGDARIFINPPPSMGGVLIAFGLELLKEVGLGGAAFGSAAHLGRLATVMALTHQARIESGLRQADMAAAAETLLHPDLLAAYRDRVVGHPAVTRGTTHISIIDRSGNAASLTVTNGEGAAYIIPGTGIMMNNMLGEEDINPDGFHRWPADCRLSSMMAPSLVTFPDGSIEVLGSGGSNRIRTAILQVLVNQLLFGMDPGPAVESPRIHVEGSRASVEAGFEPAAVTAVAEAVPQVERWDGINFFFGGVHCVWFDPADGGFAGVGDPRRGGVFQVV